MLNTQTVEREIAKRCHESRTIGHIEELLIVHFIHMLQYNILLGRFYFVLNWKDL